MVGRMQQWWRRRVDATVRAELAEAQPAEAQLAGRRAGDVLVVAIALLVHLLTLALFAGAALLWETTLATPVVVLLDLVLVGVGVVVAPLRLPRRATGWTRAQVPSLFSLLDTLAAATGTSPPKRVTVTADLGCSVVGTGRHRTLLLGLPRWATLSDHGRVALVTHALAVRGSGDMRRTWTVAAAVASLEDWRYLLLPDPHRARVRARRASRLRPAAPGLALSELLLPVVLAPAFLLVLALQATLDVVSLRPGQRAGYRAIATTVDVAGTDAVRELLRARLATGRTEAELGLAARRGEEDLLAVARAHVAALDDVVLAALRTSAGAGLLAPQDGGPPVVLLDQFAAGLARRPAGAVPGAGLLEAAATEVAGAEPDLRQELRQQARARSES